MKWFFALVPVAMAFIAVVSLWAASFIVMFQRGEKQAEDWVLGSVFATAFAIGFVATWCGSMLNRLRQD